LQTKPLKVDFSADDALISQGWRFFFIPGSREDLSIRQKDNLHMKG